MKGTAIRFDDHALYWMVDRCRRFGIEEEDCRRRVLLTVRTGNLSKKHRSRNHITFYRYFDDNNPVFVLCRCFQRVNPKVITVKTVIIERGRP